VLCGRVQYLAPVAGEEPKSPAADGGRYRTRTCDLLGVIRIGNRSNFNAIAVSAALQHVSQPHAFTKLNKSGASRVRVTRITVFKLSNQPQLRPSDNLKTERP